MTNVIIFQIGGLVEMDSHTQYQGDNNMLITETWRILLENVILKRIWTIWLTVLAFWVKVGFFQHRWSWQHWPRPVTVWRNVCFMLEIRELGVHSELGVSLHSFTCFSVSSHHDSFLEDSWYSRSFFIYFYDVLEYLLSYIYINVCVK